MRRRDKRRRLRRRREAAGLKNFGPSLVGCAAQAYAGSEALRGFISCVDEMRMLGTKALWDAMRLETPTNGGSHE